MSSCTYTQYLAVLLGTSSTSIILMDCKLSLRSGPIHLLCFLEKLRFAFKEGKVCLIYVLIPQVGDRKQVQVLPEWSTP